MGHTVALTLPLRPHSAAESYSRCGIQAFSTMIGQVAMPISRAKGRGGSLNGTWDPREQRSGGQNLVWGQKVGWEHI